MDNIMRIEKQKKEKFDAERTANQIMKNCLDERGSEYAIYLVSNILDSDPDFPRPKYF